MRALVDEETSFSYRVEHVDGLRTTLLVLNGLVGDLTVAAKLWPPAAPHREDGSSSSSSSSNSSNSSSSSSSKKGAEAAAGDPPLLLSTLCYIDDTFRNPDASSSTETDPDREHRDCSVGWWTE
eukprot:SAG22_NODE_13_length_33548_cov_57.167773_4_plen_124_part_00